MLVKGGTILVWRRVILRGFELRGNPIPFTYSLVKLTRVVASSKFSEECKFRYEMNYNLAIKTVL